MSSVNAFSLVKSKVLFFAEELMTGNMHHKQSCMEPFRLWTKLSCVTYQVRHVFDRKMQEKEKHGISVFGIDLDIGLML